MPDLLVLLQEAGDIAPANHLNAAAAVSAVDPTHHPTRCAVHVLKVVEGYG